MKILNKFIWSKTEPKNKNDVWFDGSVFRLFKEEEWQAFTLPIDVAEKVAEVIKNASEVYQEKLEAGYGIVIEDNVISVIAPDWNALANEEGYIKNRTHFFNSPSMVSPFAWEINNTSSPKKAVVSLSKDFIYMFECNNNTYYIKTDTDKDSNKKLVDSGSLYIYYKCVNGNHTIEIQHYSQDLTNTFLVIHQQSISSAVSLGYLKQLDEIFIPDTIARKSDLKNVESIPLVNVTYNELKTLRNSKKLVPGMQYRIIDYQTTTVQKNTYSANNQFDIIVVADSDDTLNEVARACIHEGDTYFTEAGANLAAWKVWYCLDNDTSRFAWASDEDDTCVKITSLNEGTDHNLTHGLIVKVEKSIVSNLEYFFEYDGYPYSLVNGNIFNEYEELVGTYSEVSSKGVIYRMIDEWNNDCPYDFKNILFLISVSENDAFDKSGSRKIASYTFNFNDGEPWDTSIFGNNGHFTDDEGVISGVYNNVINKKLYSDIGIQLQYLNEIIFYAYYNYDSGAFYGYSNNNFDVDCGNIILSSGSNNNTFKARCTSNILKEFCSNNTFGINCYANILENECKNNTFGDNCSNNELGITSSYNTFGDNCNFNSIDYHSQYNVFGKGCNRNKFRDQTGPAWYVYKNKIDDGVSNMDFYYDDIKPNYNSLQYHHVFTGVCGNFIELYDSREYETCFALNYNGDIKEFCIAELVK